MGKQWKQWNFILGGSKITSYSDCSHEIKRRLLLGRKVMTNLDCILKSRDITLSTKVHLVKAMVFPVVMMDLRVGLWRKLSARELMLLNCGVREDSCEPLGLQGNPTSVFPMNTQDWSPLGWTGWISLQSKGLSRVFSNTTVQKHQFSGAQLSLESNSHIHTDHWKNHSFE